MFQSSHKHHFCIGLIISLFCIISLQLWCAWQVYYYAKPTTNTQADAAIVLGASAWTNKPSPVFTERINHALTLYQTGRVNKLIFTGGTPKTGYNTEAEVARRFAIKQGIPSEDILFENTSNNTYQNLVNAKQLMQQNQIHTIIIVSDPFHMARARAIAKNLGINVSLSPTPTSAFNQANKSTQWRFFLQESYALFIYTLFHWYN